MSVQKFSTSDINQRARDLADEMSVSLINHIDAMYPQLWENAPRSARLSIRNTIRNQHTKIAEAMRTAK
jgi:hypothetical protein